MTHDLPVGFEIVTVGVLAAVVIADLVIGSRRPHVPSAKENAAWVGVYVALAVVFAGILRAVGGPHPAMEFLAGWVTEYSLSVDNLFVFVFIMASFSVPRPVQRKVLTLGIATALVLRGIFILLGGAIIERYTWVFYLFGGFLIYTAATLLRQRGHQDEYHENRLVTFLRRVLPITAAYDEGRLMTRSVDGRRMLTPLAVVFIAIGTTDLLFAFDSIPAIFGLTKDPFIVFSANVFALMGLRQLYFLLGGLLDRLVYLPIGLAFVLAFIGLKLFAEALAANTVPFINGGNPVPGVPVPSTALSLAVIVGVLALAALASLVRMRQEDTRR